MFTIDYNAIQWTGASEKHVYPELYSNRLQPTVGTYPVMFFCLISCRHICLVFPRSFKNDFIDFVFWSRIGLLPHMVKVEGLVVRLLALRFFAFLTTRLPVSNPLALLLDKQMVDPILAK